MSSVAELLCSRRKPQVAALALISVAFAGCSADTHSRFSQSTFSNPFSRQETTASVPQQQLPQYNRPVTQPPSQQYSSAPLPPPVSAPQSYPSYPQHQGVSGGGRGLSSYTPPSAPIENTGTVAPRSVAATKPAWNQNGGTTIIVGTSDTLDGISRRYNVSSAAILQANGYKGPRALQPGQQLIIPRASAPQVATAPAVAAPQAVAASPVQQASSVHVVNRGETLMSISRRYNVPLSQLAKANKLTPTSQLAIGSKVVVPGVKTAGAQPADAKSVQVAAQTPQAKPGASEPQQKARLATTTPDVPEAEPAKATETTSALPSFRWPARGRVIAGYGAKANGKQNDGINVAVPEGTPVKAAEDGVVAYSGNELKDYGNLVLVRHSNGYVTAYAHASELMVKRGDPIKRGQTIAKSGQTGGVSSPQLHFEIRKGSSPIDPLQFLNGT